MKETKTYELELDSFMEYSKVPMPVRMRLALNALGMKFADDGSPSAIVNRNPVPLGTTSWWEDPGHPNKRFYKQTLEVPDAGDK